MSAWWFRSIYCLLFIASCVFSGIAAWMLAGKSPFTCMLFLCCAFVCWPTKLTKLAESKPMPFRTIEGIPVMVNWDGHNQVYLANANGQIVIAYDPYELPNRVRRVKLRQKEIEIARNAVNAVLKSL